MTTIPIPHHAHERAQSLVYSTGKIRTALTGFSTEQSIRSAQQEIKRIERALPELKAMLRGALRNAS